MDHVSPIPGFQPVAPALKPVLERAVSDGRRLGLTIPFQPRISAAMKDCGGTWFPARRCWVFLADELTPVLDALAQVASSLGDYVADEARGLAVAAWRSPTTDYFTSLLDVQLLPLVSGGCALSSCHDVLVARAMRSLGARFHRHARVWESAHAQADVLEALRVIAGVDDVFVFVHEVKGVLEDLSASSSNELPISVAGAPPPQRIGGPAGDAEDTGNGFLSTFGKPLERIPVDETALARAAAECGLRDYQVAGVRHLLGLSSALLADDMGLGKSRQAVVGGRMAAGDAAVLVACPASLALNWEREIRAVYPTASIAIIGRDKMERVAAAQWIIANYERLGGLVKATSIRIGVMLVDEAHYLKEHQAGRTRNAFLLAERVPRRFLLTGTPLLSREVEVHTLLRLSGHPLGRLPLAEFRKQFAGDAGKRELLAARVSEWMLRRGKDVLKDLGDKFHQTRHLTAPDGLVGYRKILNDPALQSMPKITKLRQHLEALKLDFILESMMELPSDAKALVFCEYTGTVDFLKRSLEAAGIGCATLVGSDSPSKRMAAVDAFQQDPRVRVFIGTTQAAGVGITLTAATYVFFASLPWTPALKRQAEDRAYRSGNTRDVFVITPLIDGTIDDQIHRLLDSKREIEVSIVEANRATVG
jgi:hypothetical protein